MEIHIWGYKSLRIAGKILAGQQNLEVLKTSFLYSLKPIECKKLFLRIRTWPLVGFNKSLDLENFALDHTWGQACGDSKPAVRGLFFGMKRSDRLLQLRNQRNPTEPNRSEESRTSLGYCTSKNEDPFLLLLVAPNKDTVFSFSSLRKKPFRKGFVFQRVQSLHGMCQGPSVTWLRIFCRIPAHDPSIFSYWCLVSREWMGCWGLLGWLLIVS